MKFPIEPLGEPAFLVQAEKLAKQLKLSWLEVEVLKGNVSAQRLYLKFGFKIHTERRLTFVLTK